MGWGAGGDVEDCCGWKDLISDTFISYIYITISQYFKLRIFTCFN